MHARPHANIESAKKNVKPYFILCLRRTAALSGAGPKAYDMQQKRHPRVRWSAIVGSQMHF